MNLRELLHNTLVVVVLYKKKWRDTPLFKLLNSNEVLNDVSVFVYDNSPETDVPGDGAIYKHDSQNTGVSKAYNCAAAKAADLKKNWLLFFDQDTEVVLEYFEKLSSARQTYSHAVAFVPKLSDQYGFVSPFLWRFAKGIRTEIGNDKIKLHRYRFANSGLFVSRDAFEKAGGYEETIPLDFSDIAFAEKLRRVTDHFIVVDVILSHSFSGDANLTKQQALYRFYFFCVGAFAMGKMFGPSYLYVARAFLRSLRLSVRYKTTTFIKVFLRHARHG